MKSTLANRMDATAMAIGPLATLGILLWCASWTGAGQPSTATEALMTLGASAPMVLLWLISAMGYGWLARRWLFADYQTGVMLQFAVGVAIKLWLCSVFGSIGWLQFGGSVGAWALLLCGVLLCGIQYKSSIRSRLQISPIDWRYWLAAPALAILLLASTSAPGVLWSTEFGGYDALSYHLQLPREWAANGVIAPLTHNVYSCLPSFVEAAFYEFAVLRGDISFVYDAQLLHAAFAVIAALMMAQLVRAWIPHRLAPIVAFVLTLGTPWMIVVGSLAYNEMFVIVMLAAGWLTHRDLRAGSLRSGLIIGMLCGAAAGAKLTSVGFVIAPMTLLIITTAKPRHALIILAAAFLSGVIYLLPYFARNFATLGHPIFPFATDVFGMAHWTSEQVAIWHNAHSPLLPFTQRLSELWNQTLRFGIGAAPTAGEPWKPQWSILPWLAIGAGIVSILLSARRKLALPFVLCAVVQLLFWLFFTHLKSRFLLPAIVPCVFLVSSILTAWLINVRSALLSVIICIMLLAWALQPLVIFRSEGHGTPAVAVGAAASFTGDALTEQQRVQFGSTLFPAVAVNHLLDADAKILAIGFATPLYINGAIDYVTTWDRGILSQIMREHHDPAVWSQELYSRGYTHILADFTMIARWEASGWNDPLLTLAAAQELLQEHATLVYGYPNGTALFQLSSENQGK